MDKNREKFKELEGIFCVGTKIRSYKDIMKEIEKPLIEMVLERTKGNKVKAAKLLGINRNTLHGRIKKFDIEVRRFQER